MPKLCSLRKFYTVLLLILLSIGFFSGGYYFGRRGFDVEYKKTPPEIRVVNKDTGPKNVDFSEFWQVWDLLNEKHIARPFDPQKLMYGAIEGLVAAVGDPYTAFLPPSDNEAVTSSLNGEYQGIGAELGIKDNKLVIVAPLEGSPAEAVGIKAGDSIVKIEGVDTTGISLAEAVSKIRGAAGTVSTLTVQRGDKPEFDVKIVRDKITVKSVSWKDAGDNIAYVRLARFGDKTNQEWTDSVDQIKAQMPTLKAVILDVRGNPGGYLDGSVYIASEFMKSGVVVKEQYADGSVDSLRVDRKGVLIGYPVVVLIDRGSASASEIVTMALKDSIGAVTVGEKSFGKGTVQDARDFSDGSGVHITIAKWLSPKGTWIHNVGITLDYEVKLPEEDAASGKDPQFDKALEVAKSLVK